MKLFIACIAFAYKGWRDSDADLMGLNRRSMDGSGSQRVAGDQGDRPDSLASVEGGQASYSPPIHQQELAMGGTMDILQQIPQA